MMSIDAESGTPERKRVLTEVTALHASCWLKKSVAVPVVTGEAPELGDCHGLEANGALAAAPMIRWRPRLLLTDVVMLGMNGPELTGVPQQPRPVLHALYDRLYRQ